MPEQVQKVLDRILEWWKKFNTKQKTLLISIVAVVLVALAILAAVVSKPKMVTLVTCETTAESGQVKNILDSENISYELSADGLAFKVNEKDYANASIVLGTNDIPTSGTKLSDVFDGGFSSTEADKTKKYKLYLEEYYAEKLETLSNVDAAAVTLDLPDEDGTILSKGEQAYVTAILTLNGTMDDEQAAGLAKYLATNVGNDDTSNVLILDNSSNVLFSGQDDTSVTGNANNQLSLKTKAENQVKGQVKDVLVGSSLFDNVEVGLNLAMNFDQTTESTHEYYAPDGQTNGMVGSKSEYESNAVGGAAATPGTDSNDDDTSYVLEDNDYTSSSAGVVSRALDAAKGKDFEFLCETIKRTAFKITRVGQLVAQEASRRLGIPFGIIDLSLAPTPAVGDSVGEVLEKIGLEQVGAPGTTAALAMLNDQVKKGGIMASSYVGGLSGAFIPVSEDKNMIDAASSDCLTIEKLEAMTCVCSVGLDMIAIPGDTSASTISGLIADEAAIGMVNQKTTAVRVIPVAGKGVGEMANFGGLMGYAPIMPVNQTSCEAFVTRGGRIPAPIHSFKN